MMYHSLPVSYRNGSQTFCLLTLCGSCSHAHDIAAGQKHELQEQHFVSDQGLDLHLKNFQNDFAKNKMAL